MFTELSTLFATLGLLFRNQEEEPVGLTLWGWGASVHPRPLWKDGVSRGSLLGCDAADLFLHRLGGPAWSLTLTHPFCPSPLPLSLPCCSTCRTPGPTGVGVLPPASAPCGWHCDLVMASPACMWAPGDGAGRALFRGKGAVTGRTWPALSLALQGPWGRFQSARSTAQRWAQGPSPPRSPELTWATRTPGRLASPPPLSFPCHRVLPASCCDTASLSCACQIGRLCRKEACLLGTKMHWQEGETLSLGGPPPAQRSARLPAGSEVSRLCKEGGHPLPASLLGRLSHSAVSSELPPSPAGLV